MRETQKKILYIEDDRETAALIAEDLNERGFDVEVAHDAIAGLAAIVKLHPDLVLCDLSMPATSGFEVLKRLTDSAPPFWNMPFIFLSAMTDRDVELKARRLGADDFITKPIDFDLLEAIVTSRLERVVHDSTIRKHADMSGGETEVLARQPAAKRRAK
jgi:DNA-binding response OmpR family regulator